MWIIRTGCGGVQGLHTAYYTILHTKLYTIYSTKLTPHTTNYTSHDTLSSIDYFLTPSLTRRGSPLIADPPPMKRNALHQASTVVLKLWHTVDSLHIKCWSLLLKVNFFTVNHLVFIVHCKLFTVICLLFTVYGLQCTVYSLLLTVYCLLFTLYRSLFTIHCSTFTVYCLLFTCWDTR